jgi:hypothetical protein
MGKVIVMILLSASVVQARAQDESDDLAQSLGERAAFQDAAFQVGREDAANLDATTLGKGEKGAATPRASTRYQAATNQPKRRNGGYLIVDKDLAQRNPVTGKRVFGGTNAGKLSGEGMPITQDVKAPGFWGAGVFTSAVEKRPEQKTSGRRNGGYLIVDKNLNQRNEQTGKRVFGGTNAGKLSGEGRGIMDAPALSSLWFGDQLKRNTKSKALSGGPVPVAAPKGLPGKPFMPRVRGVPLALAADNHKSGDATFVAFALCMLLSTGVFAMLRGRSGRDVLLSA